MKKILLSASRNEVCVVVGDKYYPFYPSCALSVIVDGDDIDDYASYSVGDMELDAFKEASDLKEVTLEELTAFVKEL